MSNSRAPHHVGRFGESIVTYTLIRREFAVTSAQVDGIDLIAERNGKQLGISVKSRLFREGSNESRMVVIEEAKLKRLSTSAVAAKLVPWVAFVVALADERSIHLFMMTAEHIRQSFNKTELGYSLYFSQSRIEEHSNDSKIAYARWDESDLRRFEIVDSDVVLD